MPNVSPRPTWLPPETYTEALRGGRSLPVNYTADDFSIAGQNSFIQPPAQSPDFEQLYNVMPPVTGRLQRRTGYGVFTNLGYAARRMAIYQNEAEAVKRIVCSNNANVSAIAEDGSIWNQAIFPPSSGAGNVRSVNSTDYQFFVDGVQADLLKWNGGKNWIQQSDNLTLGPWFVSGVAPTTTYNSGSNLTSISYPALSSGQFSDLIEVITLPFTLTIGTQITASFYGAITAGSNGVHLTVKTSGDVIVFDNIPPLTATPARYSFTGNLPATTNQLKFILYAAGIFGAFTVQVNGCQLEFSSSATSLESTGSHDLLVSSWGIEPPETTIDLGAPVSGSVTLKIGRKYYLVFRNEFSGDLSDLSPVSASTGPVTAQNIPLVNIEVSTDPQVTDKLVLATADGGNEETLYLLADIPNSQTSLTDDIAENTLEQATQYQSLDSSGIAHGVANNSLPPNGDLPIKHRGRLFMLNGHFLRFSKSLDDLTTATGTIAGRYESCWPADYQIDTSLTGESPRADFSDGVNLYIGTDKNVHVIIGDSPQNFQEPQVHFSGVGVLNQETWRQVFLEGTPVGVMWLTPDFKVIGSDFNSYQDVGGPIQDVLNSINQAYALNSSASFFSSGPYDLYILDIPTGSSQECNTRCVYSLRNKKWYMWFFADNVTAQIFNVTSTTATAGGQSQMIFATPDGHLYLGNNSTRQDRIGNSPVGYAVTMRTTWLDYGESPLRKLVNLTEVMTDDPLLTETLEGASALSLPGGANGTFEVPNQVAVSQAIFEGPLGIYEFPHAGQASRDRYYRHTFSSPASSTVVDVLSYFNVEFVPLMHQ